jgi:hypothetical protein
MESTIYAATNATTWPDGGNRELDQTLVAELNISLQRGCTRGLNDGDRVTLLITKDKWKEICAAVAVRTLDEANRTEEEVGKKTEIIKRFSKYPGGVDIAMASAPLQITFNILSR